MEMIFNLPGLFPGVKKLETLYSAYRELIHCIKQYSFTDASIENLTAVAKKYYRAFN